MKFELASNRRNKKVMNVPEVSGRIIGEMGEPLPDPYALITALFIQNQKLIRRVSALENQVELLLLNVEIKGPSDDNTALLRS